MTENESTQTTRRDQNEDENVIPLGLFGNDHWTVFLRVEEATRLTGGMVDPSRLNIAYSKRSSFSPSMNFTADYPTQIKASENLRGDGRHGVKKVPGHDDIDCLADLEREGLIEPELPYVEQDKFIDATGELVLDEQGDQLSPFALPETLEKAILKHTRWSITDYGSGIVRQLQLHKETGKTVHSFVPVQPH